MPRDLPTKVRIAAIRRNLTGCKDLWVENHCLFRYLAIDEYRVSKKNSWEDAMTTRNFALVFGIIFLLVGIAGFIPGLVQGMHAEHPALTVDANSGQLLGLFPVNVLHNIVHILFGLWGLASFRSLSGARLYARGVAIIYAVLTVAGFIPGLNTMFGLVPLYGNDIWLHAVLALVAAYFGWVHRDNETSSASTAS